MLLAKIFEAKQKTWKFKLHQNLTILFISHAQHFLLTIFFFWQFLDIQKEKHLSQVWKSLPQNDKNPTQIYNYVW